MRCDQYIGLNERAEKLLQLDKTQPVKITTIKEFPNGNIVSETHIEQQTITVREKYSTFLQAFNEDPEILYKHTLENGDVYYEFLQCEPWSSGPCYFIALKDKEGKVAEESLWTDEELEPYNM